MKLPTENIYPVNAPIDEEATVIAPGSEACWLCGVREKSICGQGFVDVELSQAAKGHEGLESSAAKM